MVIEGALTAWKRVNEPSLSFGSETRWFRTHARDEINDFSCSSAVSIFPEKMASVLVSQKCVTEFTQLTFAWPCVKELLVNGINIGILFGALAIKLPQIFKIVKAKSVDGISESSLALELLSSTCACLYASLMGHPFSTWGEMLFISVQCLLLNCLFWYLSLSVSVFRRVAALVVLSGVVAQTLIHGIPPQYLPILAAMPITLSKQL